MEKGLSLMTAKRCALFLMMSISMSFGAFYPSQAPARDQIQSRAPRTQGIEPDFVTRMKLVEIVNRQAETAGLPAEIARAVVRVESDWDQDLTGHAGEIGLMQIKPETAREMGFTGKKETLYDPETNIRWGVAYLAAAYKLAGGNVCQTILKYNAGHQATRMTGAASAYCGRVRNIMASIN
jgi:soluble lytic murein transglycosylase-like protein